jgi:hypothetical protein
VGRAATQKLETSRKTWRNYVERVVVKGTISVHYTLWNPICLQNVRRNNYKSYLRSNYCRTGRNVTVLQCYLRLNYCRKECIFPVLQFYLRLFKVKLL